MDRADHHGVDLGESGLQPLAFVIRHGCIGRILLEPLAKTPGQFGSRLLREGDRRDLAGAGLAGAHERGHPVNHAGGRAGARRCLDEHAPVERRTDRFAGGGVSIAALLHPTQTTFLIIAFAVFAIVAGAIALIVVLDNLGSHKGHAVRQAIRAAGAKLFFLPPYSPDLNPIEQVFAKLKHVMRKAAERSLEDTWKRVGATLEEFKREECGRYLIGAGYASI